MFTSWRSAPAFPCLGFNKTGLEQGHHCLPATPLPSGWRQITFTVLNNNKLNQISAKIKLSLVVLKSTQKPYNGDRGVGGPERGQNGLPIYHHATKEGVGERG